MRRIGLLTDDSPRHRAGEWLYAARQYGARWFVAATWPADDEPSWAAPCNGELAARRTAIALAAGRMLPELLPEWAAIDPDRGDVAAAS